MARKGGSKEGVSRDSSQSMPVEQKMSSESSKQKIAKILDVFPQSTKDQVAKILQYYEDDENKAIDALTRDGGTEALSNWAESGNFKSKNSKNKKKKKKGKKEPGLGSSATASFDADDSSSLHSSGNVDAEVEKECPIIENRNGVLHDSVDEIKNASHDLLNPSLSNIDCSADRSFNLSKEDVDAERGTNILSVPVDSKCSNDDAENHVCVSPVSDSSDKQDDVTLKKDRYRSVKEEGYQKHSRQRTNSFRRSKTSSFSEDSTIQHNPQANVVPTKRGFERCKKDLNRQSISLQRIHSQVEKSLDESSKKLKNAFNDIRKLLDKRQELLELELAKTKEDALNLLKGRQDLAVELKKRIDRTPSLTETEWSELRSDVKQFVTERKYDDELGKTIWFQWCMDSITENVNTFGEVQPVKNVYSQRSHSALGNTVVTQNNPEPSPSSSVANEEISSAADKNDVANILDTIDDEVPAAKQDVPVPVARNQTSENRSRIFSNTKFQQSNRGGRGGYRGRGYGYTRPNNRNFNFRNNYMHYEYSDNRNHSHQERDGRMHDGSMFSYDRNMNNHRNRSDRRAQGVNYRSNTGRYRGNMGQQRQNNEGVTKIESVTDETSVGTEKANVVNGYVNN